MGKRRALSLPFSISPQTPEDKTQEFEGQLSEPYAAKRSAKIIMVWLYAIAPSLDGCVHFFVISFPD